MVDDVLYCLIRDATRIFHKVSGIRRNRPPRLLDFHWSDFFLDARRIRGHDLAWERATEWRMGKSWTCDCSSITPITTPKRCQCTMPVIGRPRCSQIEAVASHWELCPNEETALFSRGLAAVWSHWNRKLAMRECPSEGLVSYQLSPEQCDQ